MLLFRYSRFFFPTILMYVYLRIAYFTHMRHCSFADELRDCVLEWIYFNIGTCILMVWYGLRANHFRLYKCMLYFPRQRRVRVFTLIENCCSRNVFAVTAHRSPGKEHNIIVGLSWCLRMFVYSRSTYDAVKSSKCSSSAAAGRFEWPEKRGT